MYSRTERSFAATPDDVLYRVRVHTLALAEEKRSIALESASHESRTARDDRKAGIVITSLPCPLLEGTGSEGGNRARSIYMVLNVLAEYLESRGSSHRGLVLNLHVLQGMQVVQRIGRT